MKKIIYGIVIILLIGIMLISSYFIFKDKQEDKKQENTFEELVEIAEDKEQKAKDIKEDTINIEELYKINSDIIGWIKIDDTNINYPVMQTKDRPQFYLRKDFYKKYSQWGTPFLAENCDIQTSDNLIIYGHHINNSKMFGELEKYRNKDFYKNHKNIKFYTKDNLTEYEIISVFRTTANSEFKYYEFVNANNEKEFETFVTKCKELSFYNTENNAEYSDKFITLVTCDYSIKNGRLVVVAKKVL
ncbi:MAG: class B sortase [Clostridia bacterium]|nr:class B sortase [Clostridia bacterium]